MSFTDEETEIILHALALRDIYSQTEMCKILEKKYASHSIAVIHLVGLSNDHNQGDYELLPLCVERGLHIVVAWILTQGVLTKNELDTICVCNDTTQHLMDFARVWTYTPIVPIKIAKDGALYNIQQSCKKLIEYYEKAPRFEYVEMPRPWQKRFICNGAAAPPRLVRVYPEEAELH